MVPSYYLFSKSIPEDYFFDGGISFAQFSGVHDDNLRLSMRKKIPNLLSISRIIAGAVVLAVYSGEDARFYVVALVVLAIGLFTDFADGFLARRLDAVSELGYILDGLGDRSMYVALILTFVATHSVSLVIAWLLIFREVLIYALRLLMPGWYANNKGLRRFSRLHAGFIRMWFLTFLIVDGAKLMFRYDLDQAQGFRSLQVLLVAAAILTAYIGLALQARSIVAIPGE